MSERHLDVDPDGLDGVLRDDLSGLTPLAPSPQAGAPGSAPPPGSAAPAARAQSSMPVAGPRSPRVSRRAAALVVGAVVASTAAAVLAPAGTTDPAVGPTASVASSDGVEVPAAPAPTGTVSKPELVAVGAVQPSPEVPEPGERTVGSDRRLPAHFPLNGREPLRIRRPELRALVAELKQCEQLTAVGHTCSLGDPRYNLKLGKARALSARRVLRQAGLKGPRVRVVSAGALSPVADNATEQGRSVNRRVEIRCESTADEMGEQR